MVGKKKGSKQHRPSRPVPLHLLLSCPLRGHQSWCVISEFCRAQQGDAGQLQVDIPSLGPGQHCTLLPGTGDLELASWPSACDHTTTCLE